MSAFKALLAEKIVLMINGPQAKIAEFVVGTLPWLI
jgi:hypothetical protein